MHKTPSSTTNSQPDALPRKVMTGGPAEFLEAQRTAFKSTISLQPGSGDCAQALASQAFDNLESNTRRRAEGKPPIACAKGCSTCCRGFRVDATGPEILEVARCIRVMPAQQAQELTERVKAADAVTRGLGGGERLRLHDPCPMLGDDDACRVYASRPLACRGHASYDRQACIDAASGSRREIPVSVPHAQMRLLVQTALEAALLDSGLEPGQYELNQALTIALADPAAADKWFRGIDVIEAALSPISTDPKHGVRAILEWLENRRTSK
jgi:Fe-S-cluster containining protein